MKEKRRRKTIRCILLQIKQLHGYSIIEEILLVCIKIRETTKRYNLQRAIFLSRLEMLRGLVTILPINRTTLTNRYIHYLAPATTIYHRYLSIVEKPLVSAKFLDALRCLDRAYSLNLWADDLFPSCSSFSSM